MPRLKIMKNCENENKLLNKKSKKLKAPKKKKTTYYAEDGIFYCGRKNVATTNNKNNNEELNVLDDMNEKVNEDVAEKLSEELNSGLNEEAINEETADEEIKDEAIEEISDEASEEISNEVNDEIVQETKFKKVKKNTSLYELLARPFGATMEELEKELGWKKASIRGTISNLQKEQQFCLITINVIKPNLDDKSFYKETRYFIKDCEFNLFNDLFNNLPNPKMAITPAC